MNDVAVLVEAADEVGRAGTVHMLRAGGLRIVGTTERRLATVVVRVVSVLNDATLSELYRERAELPASARPRYLVVTEHVDRASALSLPESGVFGVLNRATATSHRLAAAVRFIAAGGACLPADLQGALLAELDALRRTELEPRGISLSGLNTREREVLGLVAEGLDTDEISAKLGYSQRTVKSVLSGLKRRHNFRSRSHALAFAVRTGAI
ncbi:helix-turn-helix transcriptional regulator [Amycolatopsis sp. cmx-4-54]|uniref:helix-turn-helix transcriptional regulator n=1 Tax=Amycolatopsis sp. cmx-4-54 TaxID=2790936 RepID=UPI00397E65F7